jgi:hypothetical protein
MVCRTECKGGKAPGKTPEATILGQEKKTGMTALLSNRAGGLKVSRQSEDYYD